MQKILFWIPRVTAILAILFMGMFSLDVFGGNEPPGKQLLGFLIHNIPALIIIGVLAIAWKWELIGGILFLLAALAGGVFFQGFTTNPASLIVMAPFALSGFLFILHHALFRMKE